MCVCVHVVLRGCVCFTCSWRVLVRVPYKVTASREIISAGGRFSNGIVTFATMWVILVRQCPFECSSLRLLTVRVSVFAFCWSVCIFWWACICVCPRLCVYTCVSCSALLYKHRQSPVSLLPDWCLFALGCLVYLHVTSLSSTHKNDVLFDKCSWAKTGAIQEIVFEGYVWGMHGAVMAWLTAWDHTFMLITTFTNSPWC